MFRVLSLSELGFAATQAEYIELALSNGFRALDLDVVEFQQRVQAHGLPHARRLLDSAKIKLGTFPLPMDATVEETDFRQGLEQLKPLAETAATLGCTRAITLVSPTSASRPYHENFEFHRKRYNDVATVLASHGIRLGLGFCAITTARKEQGFEFIHTLDALILLAGTIAARNVGVVLDLWQFWRSAGELPDLRKLSSQQIVAVRIADAPSDQDRELVREDMRFIPGETGGIDLVTALRTLAETGYEGPVTPNPARQQLGNVSREAAVRNVAQGLDRVWKAAGLTPAGKIAATAKK